MTTRRMLTIITDAAPAIVERLRTEGHVVTGPRDDPPDLYIAANAWHLPANAPNVDAYVDAAVTWMQRRKYAVTPKPTKGAIRGRSKRTI